MTRRATVPILALVLLTACATESWVGPGTPEDAQRALAECKAKALDEVRPYMGSNPQQSGWDARMYTGRCMFARGYSQDFEPRSASKAPK